MRRESHVRFGGRAGETHCSKDGRALRSDPYTYIPVQKGFVYLVAGDGLGQSPRALLEALQHP